MMSMLKNKWFWVLVLGVWNLGLVGMSVYLPYWRVREIAGWQSEAVRPVATPQPSPSPTVSPADARGKVLGESAGGPALDNSSRQPNECPDCHVPTVVPTSTPLSVTASNIGQVAIVSAQDPQLVPTATPISLITPTPLSSSLPNQEQVASERAGSVVAALTAGDSHSLYSLLSAEIKDIFSEISLQQSLSQQQNTVYSLIGEPKVQGEWATQQVEVQSAGTVSQYTMVLHLETGNWVLYGTMPV